ncbi:DNA-directed RNA polymerase subunit E'' [Candidatus Woesearchaeota archaeon]|nr:DNA-directed RNA polymerase subunit E'' [Candidatus Woesearchaeota archaeon]
MKKKACRKCKLFTEDDVCPVCKGQTFTTNWQGRIFFLNPKKSMIAHEMDVQNEGEYAIKVR